MDINQKSINYLKSLAAETVSNAKSGHTGSAISSMPILYALFSDHLIFNPKNPSFVNRDRFVLSAGHLSAGLYSILHLFGFDITIDDLKKFRTCGSKTPGHPEYGVVPGVETTTGPLGQGVANAVGLAIAETMFEAKYSDATCPIFDNYTYCYVGDGCLMEGVATEACTIAGTLALNKLILLYEDNNITIDGTRELSSNEDIAKKFEAMGWNTILVKNGSDYASCSKAIAAAKKSIKPTIIIFKTTIAEGTVNAGLSKAHAYPMPAEDLAAFKQILETPESFFIPDDVYANAQAQIDKKMQKCSKWHENLVKFKQKYPEKYNSLDGAFKQKRTNYQNILNELLAEPDMTGRDISGIVLNKVSKTETELVGGAADLAASTKANLKDELSFSAQNRLGKNIHYGVREHSMGSISNGIALYLKTPVFDSTFLVFSNYMLPAIRMRAMMKLPVLSIFTHDSINIGQDGPTHQPIEQLGTLRMIPDYTVFRPASKAEVVAGYKLFFNSNKPMALVLTKSKLGNFASSTIENAQKGAYVAYETKTKPKVEIFASGTEVQLALEVATILEQVGVRVISMPCESIFDKQTQIYKDSVLLKSPKLKVSIEASNDPIWYKYIGLDGLMISVNKYQTSGNGSEVYKNAGFETSKIASIITKKLKTL